MKPPKCRLCQKHHYGQCPDFSPESPPADPGVVDPKVAGNEEIVPIPTSRTLVEAFRRIEELERAVMELFMGKRKRTEYMREYMRKRREEGK